MVTDCLRAMTMDVMKAALGKADLPSQYPAVLRTYAEKAEEKEIERDLIPLIEVLGSSESFFVSVKRLLEEKNAFVVAAIESLKVIRDYEDTQTALGQQLARIREAGAQYTRAFDRELQSLLLLATGEDSPVIQIATQHSKVEKLKKDLPGIPSVQVHASLIGGARSFYNGQLRDDSWRARLMQVLQAVKNV